MEQATFLFDEDNVAEATDIAPATARLAWLLFTILRVGTLTYERFNREFAKSRKTFARDLAKLDELGNAHGFRIQKQRSGLVRLLHAPQFLGGTPSNETTALALRGVFHALGAVVARDTGIAFDANADRADAFLHFAAPRLVAGTRVADLYDEFRRAYRSRARVTFRYPIRGESGPSPKCEERTVEPHLVTYHDGRYYLVAYDRRPKTMGWRQFAIDRIASDPRRDRTFTPRVVPSNYLGIDAIGLFKSGPSARVSIALGSRIAGAIEAREWQRAQQVKRLPDGSATITFEVYDLGEAVRWALSFAPEAHVVSPPEAVLLEREYIDALAGRHVAALHSA